MARSPERLPPITSPCPAGPALSDPSSVPSWGGGQNRLEPAASQFQEGARLPLGQGPPSEPRDFTVLTGGALSLPVPGLTGSGGQGSESKRGRGRRGPASWGGAGGHGYWVDGAAGRGRAGRGRERGRGANYGRWPQRQGQAGRAALGEPAWLPDQAVGAGRSADALTRGGEDGTRRRGGAKATPGQEVRRKETGGGGVSGKLRLEQRWPQGPGPQQLREGPSVPQEGHLPVTRQGVTGAGLEFASGRCRR